MHKNKILSYFRRYSHVQNIYKKYNRTLFIICMELTCNDIDSTSDLSQDFFSIDDQKSVSSSISPQVSYIDVDAELAEEFMEKEFAQMHEHTIHIYKEYELFFQVFGILQKYYSNLPFLTTFSFIIPFIYFIGKRGFVYVPFLLLIQCILMACISFCFWVDPNKHQNTPIHKLDSYCARFTILLFIAYNLFYQIQNIPFFISTVIMGIFFYLSHMFSSNCWCSMNHIICHVLAHIFGSVSIYFTLFPGFPYKQNCHDYI